MDIKRDASNRFALAALLLLLAWSCPLLALEPSGTDLQLLPPIGSEQFTADATAETIVEAPPEQTPTRSWWVPSTAWFDSPIWDFGAELGINGTTGNSESFSLLAAANGKRETEGNKFEWDIKYGKTQTGGIETQNFALANSRWDWKFNPLWFLYNKNTLEYDEFKAFDLRFVASGGLGHHFIKTDITTLTGRWGAGVSREFGGPDNAWIPEANLGGDFEKTLTKRQKVKLTTDYYPTWEDFHDYRLVTNAHWEILLDEETNLSLKVGLVDRYDSTPNGRKPNDVTYFATLIWKL
ncbi:MAG: DUF481 domain-containing protein [Planctomycetales bacterium]|nr:DUF481 domain-containing protein [Planctomycetales bacterium]MCA9172217.1 DUF481 domain-containing protein [Planctomycetales bacterium]